MKIEKGFMWLVWLRTLEGLKGNLTGFGLSVRLDRLGSFDPDLHCNNAEITL